MIATLVCKLRGGGALVPRGRGDESIWQLQPLVAVDRGRLRLPVVAWCERERVKKQRRVSSINCVRHNVFCEYSDTEN